jgi:hypothetical protein
MYEPSFTASQNGRRIGMALTGKKGPDVSTPAGFIEMYDTQAKALEGKHGWCSIRYAYETTGKEEGANQFRIPRPQNRTPELRLATLPREYLSEAGVAALEAESGSMMAALRRGAVAAAQYGIENGNLGIEDANAAMTALGIEEFVYSTAFSGYVNSTHYFTSEARLTEEQRGQIHEAVDAALISVLESFSTIITRTSSNQITTVSSDRSSTRKAVPPAV